VAILAVVALAYFSTESLGGSAYLAAFIMGLMIGNMEMLGLGHHDEHATLLEGFLGQVAEIATLLVFVTLGLNLPFEALGKYLFGGLLVMFVLIFVARPITVLACLLPDRRGGWTGKEIAFISWCRETGVIPAAVASLLLARGVEGAQIAVSMVALAVCVTLLLQATTAGYAARRLDLIESEGISPRFRHATPFGLRFQHTPACGLRLSARFGSHGPSLVSMSASPSPALAPARTRHRSQ
jgi:potassium/hydrogen antiporter